MHLLMSVRLISGSGCDHFQLRWYLVHLPRERPGLELVGFLQIKSKELKKKKKGFPSETIKHSS